MRPKKLPEPTVAADVAIVTLDEMWHFINKKTEKLWIWRAYDPINRRPLAWVLGGRDDETCRKLLVKVGIKNRIFVTDDWDGYHRNIPEG
ncbi:insertion element IS1 protein InsB [Azospirillaceae bacterium]